MKASYSWIKDFVAFRSGTTAEDVAHGLTYSGFEVEGIETRDGDAIFEVNVTPNRGDCLSIAGLSREISSVMGVPLRKQPARGVVVKKPARPVFQVQVKDRKACPRYHLAVVEGLRVGPSPVWLVKRLESVGMRAINNVVDVTNYILAGWGQPLHAFDLERIHGRRIFVRHAHAGESLQVIDGSEHRLEDRDLVIADEAGVLALAGVMGGQGSEVHAKTVSIALEAAIFDPATVRRTSRRLGLQTESSYRFERGVDAGALSGILNHTLQLVVELCGGSVTGLVSASAPLLRQKRPIRFSPSRVSALLGVERSPAHVRKVLKSVGLGIRESAGGRWNVVPPSYRPDLQTSADLVEEVARLDGLDKIPPGFPVMTMPPPAQDSASRLVRDSLASLGLRECVHFSFVAPEDLDVLDPNLVSEAPQLANPLGQDQSVLRPVLFPSLLKTASYHHRNKMQDLSFFELRNVFRREEGELRSGRHLGLLLSGSSPRSHWSQGNVPCDFYDLKGLVEEVLSRTVAESGVYRSSRLPYLHPGKQAEVFLGGKKIGFLGEIHPETSARLDLRKITLIAELDWEALAALPRGVPVYRDFSRAPVVARDVALLVDQKHSAGELLVAMQSSDPRIQKVHVFDLYQGEQIPAGKRSVAFSLEIGDSNRTLTDEEVGSIMARLMDNLKQSYDAEGR